MNIQYVSPISDLSEARDRNNTNTMRWPALVSGVIVATIVGTLLHLLGLGMGFYAFSPDAESMQKIGGMALCWSVLVSAVAMFLGGWSASLLSGFCCSEKGFWQGIVVAGATYLLALFISVSAAGFLIGGSFDLAEQMVSPSKTALSQINSYVSNNSSEDMAGKAKSILPSPFSPLIDQISYEASTLGDSVGANVTDEAKEKMEHYKKFVGPTLSSFLQSIGNDNYETAKKNLADSLSNASGMSSQEIEKKMDAWKRSYEQVKDKAIKTSKEVAQRSAEFISYSAFMTFFLGLISLAAAGLGGVLAVQWKK